VKANGSWPVPGEHRNYGLAGGTLKPPAAPSFAQSLAFHLRCESWRRCDEEFKWTHLEALLYVEIGIDQAEHHANWGA
jgi:hypothetical protein